MLKGIEETASETIVLVKAIKVLMQDYKMQMRALLGRQYSHELLNNLFENRICHAGTSGLQSYGQ